MATGSSSVIRTQRARAAAEQRIRYGGWSPETPDGTLADAINTYNACSADLDQVGCTPETAHLLPRRIA